MVARGIEILSGAEGAWILGFNRGSSATSAAAPRYNVGATSELQARSVEIASTTSRRLAGVEYQTPGR